MFANDAVQANLGFVLSQTTHVEATVYQTRYPDIQYPGLIPVDTSANPWVTSVSYYSSDRAGAAQWVSGKAYDIPLVGLNMNKLETPVFMAGLGYDYSLEEVMQAQTLRMNLPNEKAIAARRGYEEFVDRVALVGDAAKGFNGLFNYPGVTTVAAAAGQAGATTWVATANAKTADEKIADFNSALVGGFTDTATTEMADTVVMDWSRYFNLASTPRSAGSDLSILQWLEKNNVASARSGQPITIRGVRGLATAGSGGTSRLIAYRRAPDVLKLHIPMPFQFLPAQVRGLGYEVPGVFRLGGLDIRLPKAVRYLDGI